MKKYNEEKFCDLCKEETNDAAAHKDSPKHIRNLTLYQFYHNKKKFASRQNERSILIKCRVKSKTTNKAECVETQIKATIKPNEDIQFEFNVFNNCNDEILFVGVHLAQSNSDFIIKKHGLALGENPYILPPDGLVPINVLVEYKCSNIGLYEMPIMFFFHKNTSQQSLVIIREMVVYVQWEKTEINEKQSPFMNEVVQANKIIRSLISYGNDDMFKVPKNAKCIFAQSLKIKDDASDSDKAIASSIMETFQTGITDENYAAFFHNLLWYEETIARINLKKYNMSDVPLKQQGEFYILTVPGLGEKRPSLIIGDIVFIKPHHNNSVMFEGVIVRIDDSNAYIGGIDERYSKYQGGGSVDVRFLMSRMMFERMHRAVHFVNKVSQKTRVFPQENPHIPSVTSLKNFYNPLVKSNVEQRKAVEHIVAGTSGRAPYMIHGPPGTGKTIAIVEAVLQLVSKNPKNRIMVCTDSNMAADHVACQLIQYHHMFGEDNYFLLRANSQFRVWETMPEVLQPFSNGSNFMNFKKVSTAEMDAYHIVVVTLSHAAKFGRHLDHKRPITHLFIDEAAQATEPACLIPVCGLLNQNGHLVLAGDPLQLGPVVISRDAGRFGLAKSLMERLKDTCSLYDDTRNDPNYIIMLRNNFRSHEDILQIPNEKFYGGNLRALAPEDPLSFLDILGDRNSRAIMFHGVRSKEERFGMSPSYFNTMELEIVKIYINALTGSHRVQPENIGVVTPYIRQVYKVKNWLQSKGWGNRLEVGTVEAFQGKEKRVIIISTVRANTSLLGYDAKFRLGFLVDDKRFNVALTRAKAKCIIIGNPLCLQKDAKWRAYMDKCKEHGTYFGYDAATEKDGEIEKELIEKLNTIVEVTEKLEC